MYKLLILLFSILLSSCSMSIGKKHKDIHPEFQPYVAEIIKQSKGQIPNIKIANLTMGFTDFKGTNTIGFCDKVNYEIHIDKTYWDSNPEERRLELIMHEMGHCVLHRYHTNIRYEFWHDFPIELGIISNSGLLYDGCPSSIMHPYDMGWYCVSRHKEYYMEEFFGRMTAEEYNSVLWE